MLNPLEFFLYILIVVGLLLNVKSIKMTGDYASPATLFNVFFILPLVLNRFHLSEIQSATWQDDTYLLIIIAVICFSIIPAILIAARADTFRVNNFITLNSRENQPLTVSVTKRQALILAFFAIFSQLILNILNTGYLVPAMNMHDVRESYHTLDVGFFGILLTVFWYLAAFFVLKRAYEEKEITVIVISLIVLFVPVARLARFDIMTVIISFLIYVILTTNQQKKLIVKFLVLGGILVVAGAFVADFRWSAGGAYDVSIADLIEYTGPEGPFEVFAFLYAYYPLSFENIDRIMLKNQHDWPYAYGAFMLRPILVGIFKLHHIVPGFPFYEHFQAMRDPLIGVATVSTALPEFAVDFGVSFSFIPMTIYSLIGVKLYLLASTNYNNKILYSFYAVSYFNLSFQNTFIAPNFLYIVLIIYLVRRVVLRKFGY